MLVAHVLGRLDELIAMGKQVVATRRSPSPGHLTLSGDFVDSAKFQQWRTSSLSLLEIALAKNSIHYQEYVERCEYPRHPHAVFGLAVLRSAKEDIEGGYLKKVRRLAFAEVFADFLEMADHLLEAGYKDPAASLVGAVLENGLRELAQENKIAVKGSDNLGSLNHKSSPIKTSTHA